YKKDIQLPYDAYIFKRRNFLKNKELYFEDWYPDYACSFFNKNTAHPSSLHVHQRVISTNLYKSNMHLLNYAWDSFHQLISKKNQYTEWQVEEFIKKEKKVNALSPVIHGVTAFFKAYFLKKGIFHGIDGVT